MFTNSFVFSCFLIDLLAGTLHYFYRNYGVDEQNAHKHDLCIVNYRVLNHFINFTILIIYIEI